MLLLASYRTYRLDDLQAAARSLDIELTLGTDRCHVLAKAWRDGVLTLDLEDVASCVAHASAAHQERGFAAVLGTCESSSEIAAAVAEALGLPGNTLESVRLARDKSLLRARLRERSVPTPRAVCLPLDVPFRDLQDVVAREIGWPVVVKPLLLSGSRGVMRADDAATLEQRRARLAGILAAPDVRQAGRLENGQFLVEEFVQGAEVALEGFLRDGRLEVLALFDKPDPLDGPFFEETLYITPSRLKQIVQDDIARVVLDATRAMGLARGPVHAEVRLRQLEGAVQPVVLEVAARSIGGLCARTLRFGAGISLDEVVLRGVLGDPHVTVARERSAAGVMMIPIPKAGVLRGVSGVSEALALTGIVDVVILAREWEELVPLPEGTSYLGFVFARSETPEDVEVALRAAHECLRFTITRKIDVVR